MQGQARDKSKRIETNQNQTKRAKKRKWKTGAASTTPDLITA